MEEFKNNMKQVNSRNIFSDSYQREIDTNAVKRIIRDFDPNVVNAPKLSYRDDKYWVFDGQHTIAALKQMNGGEDLMIECKVYHGMTYEDEARLFSLQDGVVTKVRIEDKLKALREAGDPDVLAFISATEICGFNCNFKSHKGKKNLICYKAAFDVFIKRGLEYYTDLLNIDVSAWKFEEGSTNKKIIGGLDCFMRNYAGLYDRERLIKKLAGVKPAKIITDGDAIVSLKGMRKYEWVILEVYNDHVAKTKKIEWKTR